MEKEIDELINKYGLSKIIDRSLELTELPLSRRLGLFPITDHFSFEMFTKQIGNFWVATEANFEHDSAGFLELNNDEQYLLKLLLAIFAIQDGDVIENIVLNLLMRAPTVESKLFLLAQSLMEAIHAHSYSMQIDNLFKSADEKNEMFTAIDKLAFLKRKQGLFQKYKVGNCTVPELFTVQASLEGIGFSSQFAIIFSFRARIPRPSLDGIFFSNKKIAEDEALHETFYAGSVRRMIENGEITTERVQEIINDFYELEIETARELLPRDIQTLKKQDIEDYIRYVTDYLLVLCGLPKRFKVRNPLSYMNLIGAPVLTNFFEKKVGEYSQVIHQPIKTEKKNTVIDDLF